MAAGTTPVVEVKTCKTCRASLPTDCFWSRGRKEGGLHFECKACSGVRARVWRATNVERERKNGRERYLRNRERHDEMGRRWRVKVKAEVIAAYGGACACCGESHSIMLNVDHVHGDGAKERKEIGRGMALYQKLRREGFPSDRYRLLCFNCNFAEANGGCPHRKEG